MNTTDTQSSQPDFEVQSSAFKVQGSSLEDRLVPLSDGRPGLRSTIHMEVRDPIPSLGGEGQGEGEPISENSCNSCLDFISSDETLDRYDEIISAAGWNLASYHRNPVFQNAHQYGDIIFTLGKALTTEIRYSTPHSALRAPHLYQRVQFATDVNPMAKIAYGLYRGKFLNAVSVGFIPLRWENGDPGSAGIPAGESKANFRRRYLEQELLEVSAVAIPANPNALALGLKSGAVEKSDLRDLAELIHQTLDTSPAPWTAAAERSADAALASDQASSTRVQRPTEYVRLKRVALQLHNLLKHV